MQKLTRSELFDTFIKHNKENPDSEPITGVIVYDDASWGNQGYTLEERSYRVSSNNRAFQEGKIANSIFAYCLDGKDLGVRLDWYPEWKVEYCYLERKEV